MFSEREAKLVGTSDFVLTRGYVQIRVVGFPWETASLEAVVRCQDGALLLRRERAEARLWVYRWWRPTCVELVTDTRFERVTFVSTVAIQASQKVLAQLLTLTRHGTEEPQHRYASALRLRRTVPNRRDETDADDARCHLLGFVCATYVSTSVRVSIQSAGRLLRRPITCGDSESWFEFLCARRPKSLEN